MNDVGNETAEMRLPDKTRVESEMKEIFMVEAEL